MTEAEGPEHEPVLAFEVVQALAVRADGVYVDGTFGRGGHSAAILRELGRQGQLVALDKDREAVKAATLRFGTEKRFSINHDSFASLKQVTDRRKVTGKVDGLLLDLGVSSHQLDDPQRGFSFLRDGPLDMRLDAEHGRSAAVWLGHADERGICDALRAYGEERYARRIARAIVTARARAPITSTGQLADIIARAVPKRESGKHPATRSFQAIRIVVNQELDALETALKQSLIVLRGSGRLVVISFHSLEDRIVKRFMRDHSRAAPQPRGLPQIEDESIAKLRVVGRPVRPSEAECQRNPRARSALMRIAERVP